MSKYIKVDDFIKYCKQRVLTNAHLVYFELTRQPGIDICFCKECVKHNTHRCHMAFDFVATDDYDFCSYGQRKEGE